MINGIISGQSGFSASSLTAFKALADQMYGISIDNEYLEPVDIPVYDSGNPEHLLITEANGRWSETYLNDLSYVNFYVEAGSYIGSVEYLRVSGTSENRRTISLYNPSNPTDITHPASLLDVEQANVKFSMTDGASYWTIDRMSNLDDPNTVYMIWLLNLNTYNIINRFHGRGMYKGIYIQPFCDYNTIQNCYIHDATHAGRINDALGVGLKHDSTVNALTQGTKIINNDIQNMGDGIQLIYSFNSTEVCSFPDTVIDYNRVWVDSSIYTDGAGNYTPTGDYMVAENAIDFKTGSDDITRPVIVTNNICWGYKQTDESVMNNIAGVAISTSDRHTKNVIFDRNIVADSQWGMHLVNLGGSASEVTNNILYNIGHDTPPTTSYLNGKEGLGMSTPWEVAGWTPTPNVPIENNSFVNIAQNQTTNNFGSIYLYSNSEVLEMNNNLFIDSDKVSGDITSQARDNNWYFNHTGATLTGTNEHIDDGVTNMVDYVFYYYRFTTSPAEKTLTGAVVSQSASYHTIAGSNIE